MWLKSLNKVGQKAYSADPPGFWWACVFTLLPSWLNCSSCHWQNKISTNQLSSIFRIWDTQQHNHMHCMKTVRSYHDGCQFWGDFGFWWLCLKINYQCVNILSFLNETLPLVIYYFVSVCEAEGILSWELSFWCSSKSPCGTPRTPRWRW